MTTTSGQIAPLDLTQFGDLPRSGQFFKIDKDFENSQIETLLKALAEKIRGSYPGAKWQIERKAFTLSGLPEYTAHASSLVVEFEDKPSFMIDSPVKERRYGYLILIEMAPRGKDAAPKYVFVQRLHCPDPESYIADHPSFPKLTALPTTVFLEPFTSNSDLRIESLSMHPLGLNKFALRRKLLEAHDVRMVTSPLGLSRTVAGAMKVVNETSDLRTLLRPRNKRLQQSGGRCDFNNLMDWAASICRLFTLASETSGLSSPFLSAFAEAVSSINGMTADACMLEVWILRDRADPARMNLIEFFDGSSGAKVQLTAQQVETMFSDMENIIKLSPGAATGSFVGTVSRTGVVSDLKIDVMTRTCKLSLPKCNIIVTQRIGKDTVDMPLAKYINDAKLFRITLDNGSVLFSSSGIHRDSELKKSASLLLSIIRTNSNLARSKTEKGETQQVKASKFESTSVFSLIETELAKKEEWLLCDDSDDEWGDYVSLSMNSPDGPLLRWYHAKLHRHYDAKTSKLKPVSAGQPMRSASKLQEVVGQAVKNLGRVRLQLPNRDIDDRIDLWEKVYAWPDGKKLVSAMPRLRKTPQGVKGNTRAQVIALLKQCSVASGSPVTRVEVALVIPNYGKASLTNSFKNLGTQKATKTAPQVFWLLSGFMSSCIEANVTPVIYCCD